MYIVKDGKVEGSYSDCLGKGEISDAVLMTDGNMLVAHQYGIAEIDPQGEAVWSYPAPEDTEIHTVQPLSDIAMNTCVRPPRSPILRAVPSTSRTVNPSDTRPASSSIGTIPVTANTPRSTSGTDDRAATYYLFVHPFRERYRLKTCFMDE